MAHVGVCPGEQCWRSDQGPKAPTGLRRWKCRPRSSQRVRHRTAVNGGLQGHQGLCYRGSLQARPRHDPDAVINITSRTTLRVCHTSGTPVLPWSVNDPTCTA
jgi:hypothetical protein